MAMKSTLHEPPAQLAASIVRVGRGGRGFIVNGNDHNKLVITAGHCLPGMPPCMNISHPSERTFKQLVGPIGQEPIVSVECMFVDPISDLAILGSPDDQDLSEECDAYQAFVDTLAAFLIADIPPTPRRADMPEGELGWVLSLAGAWEGCRMSHFGGAPLLLPGAKIDPGMSGSPILSAIGSAIGVITSGNVQARLLHSAPGWLRRCLSENL